MYKTDVFISAEEIKEIVAISKSKAYSLIQQLNAEIVSYNVIRYHRKKAADYLKSLGKRLPIEDFSGRHAVKFFEEQWNQLVEKYSF